MRVRWLVAVCAFALLCGTPLASARVQDLPSGTVPVEATGPGGARTARTDRIPRAIPPPVTSIRSDDTTSLATTVPAARPVRHTRRQDTKGPAYQRHAGDQTAATFASGAVVSWTRRRRPTSSSGDVAESTALPASGSDIRSESTTTVNCSASDAGGNSSSASFTVTVALVINRTNIGVPDTHR